MKVHCPKCNSVNFLPSTLPSSIISNISCAVCKEMISVPERPELELPDEDLMDVSSLRDKLDDKGFLLAPDSQKTEDRDFEILETAPLTALGSEESYRFDDTLSLGSDDTNRLDDTLSLNAADTAALGLNETVSPVTEHNVSIPVSGATPLSDDTLSLNYDDTASLTTESFSQTVSHTPDEMSAPATTEELPPQQAQADIWEEIRNEINASQQAQANIHPPIPAPAPPQVAANEIGPLLIDNEPQRKSGIFKFLLFGFLLLALFAAGGWAVWHFVFSDNGEETAQQTPPLKSGSNPSSSNGNTLTGNSNNQTANSNEKSINNTNADTNVKNQSNKNSKNKNENKSSTAQSNNSHSNNSNSQNTNSTSDEKPANNNSGGQSSPGANSGEGKFTIQVGSYPNAEAANSKVAQLQSAGVPARVVIANIPKKGTWYRIHVGRFANREQAERYARELKSKGVAKELFVTDVQ